MDRWMKRRRLDWNKKNSKYTRLVTHEEEDIMRAQIALCQE